MVAASPTSSPASPASLHLPGEVATPASIAKASASTAAPVHSAAAVVAVLLAGYQIHAFVLLGCGDHLLGQGREPLLAHVDRVYWPEIIGHLLEVGPGADHP